MAVSTTINDLTNATGNFKEVYAKEIENLLPDDVQLQRDIEFIDADGRPGLNYHQPVITKHEHGISYKAASSTTVSNDGFDIAKVISGRIEDATVVGSQILARTRIGYETMSRSLSDKGSFRRIMDPIVENLMTSVARRAEIDLFYGGQPLALVSSVSTNDVLVAAAQWAPGIWIGQEGALLEAWIDDTSAAATAAGTALLGVNDATRTLSVTSGTQFTASDHIHFSSTVVSGDLPTQRIAAVTAAGAGYNSMRGLMSIASGISGGAITLTSIFGINPTTSSLWKAVSYDCLSGPLSLQKINKGCAQLVAKGAPKKLNLYCNPKAWADLANDEAAQRRYANKAGGTFSVGPEGMQYYTQTGVVTIKATPYMKEGEAVAIDPSLFRRVGTSEITFNLPGKGDEFFLHIPDVAAFELRCYMNYGLFTKCPGKILYFKNIVNNA